MSTFFCSKYFNANAVRTSKCVNCLKGEVVVVVVENGQELLVSLSRQLQEVENTWGENIAPGDVELQANIKRIEAIMNAFGINYPTTDTDSDAQPYYTPEAVDDG
jgi:hypothetical protein